MLKLKHYLIAIVVAGVAITPIMVSHSIDSKIEENRILLEKNGFKQDILSKSGYLNSTRAFSLEVVDSKKAQDFLLDKLVEKNAQYKIFAQSMKSNIQDKSAFNGLKFKGEMFNSNLLPTDTKVSLALDKLPQTIHDELVNTKELGDAFLPLIAKGVLAVDMTFGSDIRMQKITLKTFKVRDIKENIKIKEANFDIDALNQTLSLDEKDGLVNGVVGIQKQNFSLSSEILLLKSELENLKYNFAYKDDFNNKSDLQAGKYAFEMAEAYSHVIFSLGGLRAISSIEEVDKNLYAKADYTINAIEFVSEVDAVKLDKLLVKLDLRNLHSEMMKKLQEDYRMMVLGEGAPSDQVLIDNFVALINHGVKIDLGVAFQGLSGEINLKDVSIDTTLEIAKNNYTDKQSPLAILNLLDISAKVKLHKEDKQTLEALSFAAPEDFAYGKIEGDFFIYDIKMKEGELSVNGKVVQ